MNTFDQEPKSLQIENNETAQSLVIGVRCPQCLKLYAVDKSEIKEAKPKFECNKCHTRFWIPFSGASALQPEIIGFPVSWLEDQDVNKPEPKKPEPVVLEQAPADTFALVEEHRIDANQSMELFARFHHDVGVPHSRRLRDLWNLVVDDYANEDLHRQFVKMCQKENNLAFASKKYAHILNTVSVDEMAVKMIREIDNLVQAWLTKAQVPKKKTLFSSRIAYITLGVGLVLIALGLSVMQFRNLVGVGVVLTFLTLAWQGLLPSKK